MNITITQDNSRVEVLGSNGAGIIEKLYELATDPNNTLTLEGNISSTSAYGYLVDYLNTNYGPDFIVNATNRYIRFQDDAVLNVLKNSIGDGVGVFEQLLKNANPNSSLGLNGNTNITDTRELCLIEGTDITGNFCSGCTNIKVLGLPKNVTTYPYAITENVNPEKIVIADLAKWCGVYIGSHNFGPNNNGNGIEICTLNNDGSLTTIKNLVIPSNAQFLDSGWCTPFTWTNIDSVAFPSTLTLITGFNSSFVKTITFEQNSLLNKIAGSTFEDCSNLVFDVSNIPQSVTTIEQRAFRRCGNVTGTLNLPNLTSLGSRSFFETGITSIQNLGSVTSIPEECFSGCTNLTSVVFPLSLTSMESGTFGNCINLTSVDFQNCTNLTTIADRIFMNCNKLTSIDLSNTKITKINTWTVMQCSLLNTIKLPDTITEIKSGGLLTNTSIEKSIILLATTPPILEDNNAFGGTDINNVYHFTIYVPDASLSTYQNAGGYWSTFTSLLRPLSDYTNS